MDETISGRYKLEERLGTGGMAQVWLARDTQLDRHVALKLLGTDADPQRFEREAQAIASLSHPNICGLYDYGSEGGRVFMVFEHLPGGTLEERLAAGRPLDDADSERIAAEVAAGLAHAHDRGLIHRDLKPTNIVFDEEDRAKIADFGIARVAGKDTLTEAGTLMGTAAYMSPEQAQGEPVTPASDVYSFGVILYRMLTGRLPFESPSAVDLLRRQLVEEPMPVRAARPDAPASLAEVAESSLAKDPARRPPNGRALVDLLSGDVAPTLVAEGPAVTQVMPRPASRRSPLLLAALIVVPLLVIAGIALALLTTNDDPKSSPATGTTSTETTPVEPPPPAATASASAATATTTSAAAAAASTSTSTSSASATAAATAPAAAAEPPPPPPPDEPPPPLPPPPPA